MEKEQPVAPMPEKEKEKELDTTLKDILADKEKSSRFGELLKSSGSQDIAERLLKGKLAEGDLEKLDERRKEFNRKEQEVLKETRDRKELWEKARETLGSGLTKEALTQFAGQSKSFDIILKAVGAEGARRTIMSQLEALAMRDPGRLNTILEKFEKFSENSKAKNNPDAEIGKIREKYHVTEDELNDILRNNPDRESRKKALQGKIAERMKRIAGVEITMGRSSESRAEKILKEDEVRTLQEGYKNDLQVVGDAMEAAISKNEEVQEAFMSVLLGKEIAQAPKEQKEEFLGFQEMRGMMPEEDALKREYTTWADAERSAGNKPDNRVFAGSYMGEKMGNKKSSWGDITRNMIMGLLNKF